MTIECSIPDPLMWSMSFTCMAAGLMLLVMAYKVWRE
jgi:hypothetical protein